MYGSPVLPARSKRMTGSEPLDLEVIASLFHIWLKPYYIYGYHQFITFMVQFYYVMVSGFITLVVKIYYIYGKHNIYGQFVFH